MTKETIRELFTTYPDINFKISTNIYENDVDGKSPVVYYGKLEQQNYKEETKISELLDDGITLIHKTNKRGWDGREHIIFLPYKCINLIDFIGGDNDSSDIYYNIYEKILSPSPWHPAFPYENVNIPSISSVDIDQ